jgi:hypothetical protein
MAVDENGDLALSFTASVGAGIGPMLSAGVSERGLEYLNQLIDNNVDNSN